MDSTVSTKAWVMTRLFLAYALVSLCVRAFVCLSVCLFKIEERRRKKGEEEEGGGGRCWDATSTYVRPASYLPS